MCQASVYYCFLGKQDQKDGIAIDIVEESGRKKARRLELLCRTLEAESCYLVGLVRELDFCSNMSEMPYFFAITIICKNITQLYLRGPDESNAMFKAPYLKSVIKETKSRKVLVHDGVFPCFTITDIAKILANCPLVYSLSLRLTK